MDYGANKAYNQKKNGQQKNQANQSQQKGQTGNQNQ